MMRITFLLLVLASWPGVAMAQKSAPPGELRAVFRQGRWGYADARGKVVIEPRFDAAADFDDGLARVGIVDEEVPELDGRPNLRWGYIDERGAVVIPLQYASVRRFTGELAAVAVRVGDSKQWPVRARIGGDRGDLRWGYVDRKGQVAIPPQFLSAGDFAEGLAAVNVIPTAGDPDGEGSFCDGPRNFGYIDTTGAIIIAPRYTSAGIFVNGKAQVGKGRVEYVGRCVCCAPRFHGVVGHIDRTGKFTQTRQTDDLLLGDGVGFP
jgi:hypothetical protein